MEMKVVLSKEQAEKMSAMTFDDFFAAGEEIAINEGYHPAGYGFFSPKLIGNVFVWNRLDSCD